MSSYRISIQNPGFNLIKSHKKTVEGRLDKGVFSHLQVGDTVYWYHTQTGEEVKTNIENITKYPSFTSYLSTEGLETTLPLDTIDTIDKGVDLYYRYYTPEKEQMCGVLALQLKIGESY